MCHEVVLSHRVRSGAQLRAASAPVGEMVSHHVVVHAVEVGALLFVETDATHQTRWPHSIHSSHARAATKTIPSKKDQAIGQFSVCIMSCS
jgi:hypothetical protein